MKNFILSSEDGSELTAEQKKKFDISTLQMSFLLDGQEYSSKNTPLTMKEFCDKMRKGSSTKTSQPNEFEVEEYLTELLKEGKDDILYKINVKTKWHAKNLFERFLNLFKGDEILVKTNNYHSEGTIIRVLR